MVDGTMLAGVTVRDPFAESTLPAEIGTLLAG